MRRRTILAGIALSFAAGSRAAFAQAPGKLPLVGILGVDPGPLLDAFRQGLQKFGYVEGQTIVLAERSAPGHPERLGCSRRGDGESQAQRDRRPRQRGCFGGEAGLDEPSPSWWPPWRTRSA